MSEKLTSNKATGERVTGNGATSEESTGRPIDSLPISSSLVNSLLRYWLPPVLWMGVIFILSAQPSLPHAPDTLLDLILKKATHMIEYGILAFLLWRALARRRNTFSHSALAIAFLISVLYAASDEYHQTFVPGRHGTLVDVGVDTVGVLVALLVVGRLGRRGKQGDTP